MTCIGTAGHVDHGKSTLVQALTGIDPDRLAEEKARGMTIDLGFAWLTLPSGHEVSIVDVPGHENFIKNMLAGIGGIDAALLVVAADEGIMPQTREHLAILDLLRVSYGVVALTKTDLVDQEWLELIQDEVHEILYPTSLSQAELVPCSAYTGQGLPELLVALDRMLDNLQKRTSISQNSARPRLPIDRVFSLSGFGTIVTGTLQDGPLTLGQEIEILPQGLKARIRNMQMHQQRIEHAHPGSRVALNIPNVARTELARGNVICLPDHIQPTMLCDARITLLADAPRPLTHNALVDFYCGSQEIPAHVRLLDTEELSPGKSAWVQIRLSRPTVVVRRDRFILRIPSPGITVGGGEIIDVSPRYHRRFREPILQYLEQLSHGTPEELVLAALDVQSTRGMAPQRIQGHELAAIAKQCNLSDDVTRLVLETLVTEAKARLVGEHWFAEHIWQALTNEAVALVHSYHAQYPLRSGISKEEWRARLHLSPKLATDLFALLQREGRLQTVDIGQNGTTNHTVAAGLPRLPVLPHSSVSGHPVSGTPVLGRTNALIRLPDFVPHFTSAQQQQVQQLLNRFALQPYRPPGRTEVEALVGGEILHALIEQGRILKFADGVLFTREAYEEAVQRLLDYMHKHGKMTVSEARDILSTSRKYILPLLEHLDVLQITRRQGDERVLL
jgi:selenocysteine-specific elongation factor